MSTMTQTAKAVNLSSTNDEKYEIYLSQAPEGLLNLSLGSVSGTEGEPQLIMSTESLKALKRYENRAGTLPKNADEMRMFLGGIESIIDGLTNSDLLKTYGNIQLNVAEWQIIENGLLQTGSSLETFGNVVTKIAPTALDLTQNILIYYATGSDINLSEITIEQLHNEEFMKIFFESFDLDADIVNEHTSSIAMTMRLVDTLISESTEHFDKSTTLKDQIGEFKLGMIACRNDVKFKHNILETMEVSADLEKKRETRRNLVDEIKKDQDSYDYNQEMRWISVGGLICIIIAECVYHKEAKRLSKVIQDKNNKLHQLDFDISRLQKLEYAVTSVDTQFQSLETIFTQAEQGITHVQYTWGLVVDYLTQIRKGTEKLESASELLDIWIALKQVTPPWEYVAQNARVIVTQIQEAIEYWDDNAEQYTKDYCINSASEGFTPTQVDINKLTESAENIRVANSKLSPKFNSDLNHICQGIYGYVQNTQSDVHTSIRFVQSQSSEFGISSSLNAYNSFIESIQEQIDNETDPESIKEHEQQIKRLKNSGSQLVTEHIKTLSENHIRLLVSSKENITFNSITKQVEDLKRKVESNIEENNVLLKKYFDLKTGYAEDIKALRAAQKLLSQYRVFEFFNDIIPTAEEIAAISGIKEPHVQLIVLGLDVFKTLTAYIGNGFSYNKLTQAIEWVMTEQLQPASDIYDEKELNNYALLENHASLLNISIIDLERTPFCEEVSNLIDCYQDYITFLSNSIEQYTDFKNTVEILHLMHNHMKNFSNIANNLFHNENPDYQKLSTSVDILLDNQLLISGSLKEEVLLN